MPENCKDSVKQEPTYQDFSEASLSTSSPYTIQNFIPAKHKFVKFGKIPDALSPFCGSTG